MGGFLGSILKFSDPGHIDPLNQALQRSVAGHGTAGRSATPLSDQYGPQAIDQLTQMMPVYATTYQNASPAEKGGRSFEQWLQDHMAVTPNDDAKKALDQFSVTGQMASPNGGDGTEPVYANVPFEQGFGQYVQDNYIYPDLQADKQRQSDAQSIIASYNPLFQQARNTIAGLNPTIDTHGYFAQNPDVKAQFDKEAAAGSTKTAEQFVQDHWQNFGQYEGRQSPIKRSGLLTEQLGYNDDVTAQQQAALQQSVAARMGSLNTEVDSLKSNLSGELSAKAAALQTQLQQLNDGLNTMTAAQRQAAALQLESNFKSLESEVAARKDSLSTELNSLGTAVDDQSNARKAALTQEIAGLNAAQAPLNNIRTQGAETLATTINLGVQNQKDQIKAGMAQQGYVGGSTGTDMALERAAIGGHQQAAQAVADANTQNATDTAGIAKYGATAGYGIDTDTAGQKYNIAQFGAGANKDLSDYGSGQTRAITDTGAADTRAISNADATARAQLTQYGAGANKDLADYGATAGKAIGDFGATQTKANSDYSSDNTLGIANSSAQRQLGYFDQDISRRLASLSLPTEAVNAEFAVRNAADNYGQSGLQRSFNNLNFFNLGNGSAPTNGTYTGNQPVNSGYENLGAGLLSVAGGIGQANNWWQAKTPVTSAPNTNFNYTSGGSNYSTPILDAGSNVNGSTVAAIA